MLVLNVAVTVNLILTSMSEVSTADCNSSKTKKHETTRQDISLAVSN